MSGEEEDDDRTEPWGMMVDENDEDDDDYEVGFEAASSVISTSGSKANRQRTAFLQRNEGVSIKQTEEDPEQMVEFGESMSALERLRLDDMAPLERKKETQLRESDFHAARNSMEREELFKGAISHMYDIDEKLGQGHNGIVYSARDKVSGRKVAIKFLSQQKAGHVGRRLREIAAQGLLPPHSNIVQLESKQLHSEGTFEYFVMELCEMSLAAWIEQTAALRADDERETLPPALDAPSAIRILHELVDALLTLEQFGVTHRDVKPSNVLLVRRPGDKGNFPFTVKLADFGVANLRIDVEKVTQYKNYIGVKVHERTAEEYRVDDDFRGAVATVYFAWLGEKNWNDDGLRQHLYRDEGFRERLLQLELSPADKIVRDLLERALPLPRAQAINEVFGFHGALDRMQNVIAQQLNIRLALESPRNQRGNQDDAIGLPDEDESGMNAKKFGAMAGFALSAVSGRRVAKDYESARKYLEWANDLFQRSTLPPSDMQLGEYHSQWAMAVYLPAAQKLVRRLGSNATYDAELEETLKALDERVARGRECFEKAYASDPTDTMRPIPSANLANLAVLERIKYYKAVRVYKQALNVSMKGRELLESSLARFSTANGVDESEVGEERAKELERFAFQHCRNYYLLLVESLKCNFALENREAYEQLAAEAVAICERGVGHVTRSRNKSKQSDRLEMKRCLAEAVYFSRHYDRAKNLCEQLIKENAPDLTLRARVLRVQAIWIAVHRAILADSPSEQDSREATLELGFVCGDFVATYLEAAESLGRNEAAVGNAEQFLACSRKQAITAGANELYPIPLLPMNGMIRVRAGNALDAIKKVSQRYNS